MFDHAADDAFRAHQVLEANKARKKAEQAKIDAELSDAFKKSDEIVLAGEPRYKGSEIPEDENIVTDNRQYDPEIYKKVA